jgi:hypothetical protein
VVSDYSTQLKIAMIKKLKFPVLLFLALMNCYLLSAQDVIKPGNIKPADVKSFKTADIGNPAIPGITESVKSSNGGFNLTAGGADIWGVKDEFGFIYFDKNGDFDFLTRVESLTAPHLYTKAGIMAREDLTAGSRHIYFQLFPDNRPRNKNNGGFEFQYRQVANGEMKAIYPASAQGAPEFPVTFPDTWIRLRRVKNDFTGFYSTDGINWKVYTTYTLELPSKVYLGLAVTSHNPAQTATAVFRNIGEVKTSK